MRFDEGEECESLREFYNLQSSPQKNYNTSYRTMTHLPNETSRSPTLYTILILCSDCSHISVIIHSTHPLPTHLIPHLPRLLFLDFLSKMIVRSFILTNQTSQTLLPPMPININPRRHTPNLIIRILPSTWVHDLPFF